LAAIAVATSKLTFGSTVGVLAISTSLLILVKAFDAILKLDVGKVKKNIVMEAGRGTAGSGLLRTAGVSTDPTVSTDDLCGSLL
jgi:hypothetical protein